MTGAQSSPIGQLLLEVQAMLNLKIKIQRYDKKLHRD